MQRNVFHVFSEIEQVVTLEYLLHVTRVLQGDAAPLARVELVPTLSLNICS